MKAGEMPIYERAEERGERNERKGAQANGTREAAKSQY
jgi:hypothetical protein